MLDCKYNFGVFSYGIKYSKGNCMICSLEKHNFWIDIT